jgi:hypothetical protein
VRHPTRRVRRRELLKVNRRPYANTGVCHVVEKEMAAIAVMDIKIAQACIQREILLDLVAQKTGYLIIGTCAPSSSVTEYKYRRFGREQHLDSAASDGIDPVLLCGNIGDSISERRLKG